MAALRRALVALLAVAVAASAASASPASPNPFAGAAAGTVSVRDVEEAAARALEQDVPRREAFGQLRGVLGRGAEPALFPARSGRSAAPMGRAGFTEELAAHVDRAAAALEGVREAAKMTCSQCQTYVNLFDALMANNASRASILALADAKCDKMGLPKDLEHLCEDLAEIVVNRVLPIVAAYTHKLPYSPEAFCAFFDACTIDCCNDPVLPEQAHLAFGNTSASMAVSWVTQTPPPGGAAVRWGPSAGNLTEGQAAAQTRTYTFAGWRGLTHGAVMTGLRADTRYFYQLGAPGAWTGEVHSFRTLPEPVAPGRYARPLRFAVLGDMGMNNSHSTRNALVKLAQANKIDGILHNGDISYADGAQRVWDEYLRWIEPYAAYVPLMVSPGNHEIAFVQGYAYRARFFMPHVTAGLSVADGLDEQASSGNMYYSFNAGPLHVLALSTESVIDTPYVYAEGASFIKADLAAAATPAARADRPWIVAMGHRPLYCTDGGTQCGAFAAYLRKNLEEGFSSSGTDLVFGAHRHSYQRTFPLYQGQVVTKNLTRPGAPVYVLNGAAGNREGLDRVDAAPYLAAGAGMREFGYGILEVQDGDSLTYTQYASSNGTVLDTFTLRK